jgi:hypothetical protein
LVIDLWYLFELSNGVTLVVHQWELQYIFVKLFDLALAAVLIVVCPGGEYCSK